MVLQRTRRTVLPYRVFVDQIGMRAYDAGGVYIEVAEFRRSSGIWKVIPLTAPLPYSLDMRPQIEQVMADALLHWVKARLE